MRHVILIMLLTLGFHGARHRISIKHGIERLIKEMHDMGLGA